MSSIRKPIFFVTALSFALFAYACSEDEVTSPPATTTPDGSATPDTSTPTNDASNPDTATPETVGPVQLAFEAKVGSEAFACGKTFTNLGMSNASATAGDLRFFVHDIKLLKGTTEVPVALDVKAPWQNDKVGLIDFENKTGECEFGTPETNAVLEGKVLGSGFDGITFTIGVPEALNHLNKDTQAAPLLGSGLNWDWNSGYIHFALQVNSNTKVGDVRVPSFFAHVGSAECSGGAGDGGTSTCTWKNRPVVKLTGFDPTKNKIVLDAKKLFETSNIDMNTDQTIPGCMSSPNDPECPPIFTKLGLDPATGASMGPASIFSVGTK